MRAATYKPKYTFQMDRDITKLVDVHFRRGVVAVTVRHASENHVTEGVTYVIAVLGQPVVQEVALGIWLGYRYRPIALLPWLTLRHRRFF